MEFTKCQGCQLLTSIPAAARQSLHHFEVAAVLQPFQARPPLPVGRSVPQKSFVYVVVTDWSLLVVSMPSSKAGPVVLLEVPLLLILNLVSALLLMESAAAGLHENKASLTACKPVIYTCSPSMPTQQPRSC